MICKTLKRAATTCIVVGRVIFPKKKRTEKGKIDRADEKKIFWVRRDRTPHGRRSLYYCIRSRGT